GMATNIPPHNLTEILNACIALVDDDDLPDSELFRLVPGPDFPTAGILLGNEGAIEAYRSGRGRVVMRARAEIETDAKSGRQTIAVSELPYQVNKAKLIERIAEMVKEKRLDGISDLRDESDKSGMRIAIELKRDANAEVVLNNLYQHTALQSVFNINMVALLDGAPQTLGLRDALKAFLRHRREVVTRRSIFDLKKARDRAHILEGLAVALVNLDPLIALIRAAASPAEAKAQMLARVWEPGLVAALLAERGEPSAGLQADGYHLSEAQAQAILDLRLHRLTGLEQDKIREEYLGLLERIRELLEILGSDARLMAVIRAELVAIRDQYGDARRSEIVADTGVIANEDLIAEENMVVTFTHAGYIKAQPVTTFNAQRRGGRGKVATTTKEEDFVERMFCASTHATVLFFSNLGKVFWQKVYQLPQSGRSARGKPIVNLLSLAPSEGITTVLPVREFQEGQYVCMVTAHGVVKKTPLMEYSRPRSQGINAINLDPGDRLVAVCLSDGQREFMLFTRKGMAVRFPEDKVRPMGRTARGVRGISLDADDRVISAQIVDPDQVILTATAKGYGKLTNVEEYRRTNRGGKGVIAIQTNARNGQVVGALAVKESDELMLVSNGGTLIRIAVQGIRRTGRNAQGVRLIQLAPDEQLAGLALIADAQEEAGQCDFELEGE
ncbi:DNA gyrase subunit A, partial [Acidithiobacillus caldus]